MEKSKQCSYGVENVYVLIDFVYENDLVAVEWKVCFKKGVDLHLGDDIRLRKN